MRISSNLIIGPEIGRAIGIEALLKENVRIDYQFAPEGTPVDISHLAITSTWKMYLCNASGGVETISAIRTPVQQQTGNATVLTTNAAQGEYQIYLPPPTGLTVALDASVGLPLLAGEIVISNQAGSYPDIDQDRFVVLYRSGS